MIYVIGKNGYIGSNLINYFGEKGVDVCGVGRGESFTGSEGNVIINCAAYGLNKGQTDIEAMTWTNAILPMRFFDSSKCKFIQLSSSSEIVEPHTAYARTKSLASDYLRGKATLCYIYSAWGGFNQHPRTFMAALLKAKRNNTTLNVTAPDATRDFVHIKHICEGIEELINKPIGDYHFGTGNARRLGLVARLAGVQYTFENNVAGFTWKAADPYFKEDTFEADLAEELRR